MGKFRDKLKGRRQSTNIEDARNRGSDYYKDLKKKERQESQDLQDIIGNYSKHLRNKTDLSRQESDAYTKFKNVKARDPERMYEKAKKLVRLGDDVFPKEFSKPFK